MRAAGLVSPAFSARIGQAHAAPLRVQIRASHFPCTRAACECACACLCAVPPPGPADSGIPLFIFHLSTSLGPLRQDDRGDALIKCTE